jgi:hypothetical protein
VFIKAEAAIASAFVMYKLKLLHANM